MRRRCLSLSLCSFVAPLPYAGFCERAVTLRMTAQVSPSLHLHQATRCWRCACGLAVVFVRPSELAVSCWLLLLCMLVVPCPEQPMPYALRQAVTMMRMRRTAAMAPLLLSRPSQLMLAPRSWPGRASPLRPLWAGAGRCRPRRRSARRSGCTPRHLNGCASCRASKLACQLQMRRQLGQPHRCIRQPGNPRCSRAMRSLLVAACAAGGQEEE